MASLLDAVHLSKVNLPVIPIDGLSSSSLADRQRVATALRNACIDKGFFYVSDHGIPAGLIDAVFEEARRFFDLPPTAKSAVDKSRSFCNRGCEPLRAQKLEAGAPPDLKESFYIGPELALDDPRVVARRFNRGPNLWPHDMAGFRPTMQAYFVAMLDLGERLMHGPALSLDLPENHFEGFSRDSLATPQSKKTGCSATSKTPLLTHSS